MNHTTRRTLAAAFTLALMTGCGGGDSPTGSGGSGPMTAQIDGSAWSAQPIISVAQYNETDDLLVITGLNTQSYSISINLDDVTTTGTYALTNGFPLRFAVISTNAGGSWASSSPGGSGSVTIGTFSSNRLVGTFVFTAPALGTSTQQGTLTVTSGQFDLPLNRLNP